MKIISILSTATKATQDHFHTIMREEEQDVQEQRDTEMITGEIRV